MEKRFEEMTVEERRKVYDETQEDISGCCDYWCYTFEEMDGICPKCGRATLEGNCVCGCNYSPVECDECGARPCDLSC